MLRVVAVWLVLMLLLAGLGAPPSTSSLTTVLPTVLPASWSVVAIVGFAVFASIGTSTSRLLSAVREGKVIVDDSAPSWGLWRRVWTQGLIAGVLLFAVCSVAEMTAAGRFGGALIGGFVGVAVGALVRVPARASAIVRSLPRWLVLEGAVPTALAAAALGGILAAMRFGAEGSHAAGAVSRMLAGTFLCDALLGFGGFAKSWTERRFGLVRAPLTPLPEVPGPVVVALALAAVTVIFGPRLLPPMSATAVIVLKTVSSAVVAGGLTMLGAVRGAAAAAKSSASSSTSSSSPPSSSPPSSSPPSSAMP